MNFISHVKDCKKFKSNNKRIALNGLFVKNDQEKIKQVYNFKA